MDKTDSQPPRQVVLLDPIGNARRAITDQLRPFDWIVRPCSTPQAAKMALIGSSVAIVDMEHIRNSDDLVGLADVIRVHRRTPWIALLPRWQMTEAHIVDFICKWLTDYHSKPIDPQRLAVTLGHAAGMAQLARFSHQNKNKGDKDHSQASAILGESKEINALRAMIPRIARSDAPVLVTGESGTGKEIVAHEIHYSSPRSAGPLEIINCGALPPTLTQSELFGHNKGAFTGADRTRIGRIEAASGGTLFLDEIAELPLESQASLLRFLQDGSVQRLGGPTVHVKDVRVIAATNTDLERSVAEGRFRADLFHRLHVLTVELPPLRQRSGDAEILAEHYLATLTAHRPDSINLGFSKAAREAIRHHSWPGNVRELVNRVHRATVMCGSRVIEPIDLGLEKVTAETLPPPPSALEDARMNADKRMLNDVLHANGFNITHTARDLGVSRMTVYRMLRKHGLEVPPHPYRKTDKKGLL